MKLFVKRYLLFFVFTVVVSKLHAQDSSVYIAEVISSNVDSLIQDSLRKAFILNHKPLKEVELNQYKARLADGVYGQYVTTFIRNADVYKIRMKPQRMLIIEHEVPHREWIFYSFILLLFSTAVVNAMYPVYYSKLMKIFLNPSLVFGQSRETSMQDPFPSFFYQFLFFFSAALFMYFGFASKLKLLEIHWTRLVFGASFAFMLVYVIKQIVLMFLGWVFKQREVFENYAFLVTLINKIGGAVLLIFALLLAYATNQSIDIYFKAAIFCIAILFMLRLFRGYQIFKRQSHTGLFTFLIAFISLELLPTCVLLKMIMDQLVLRKIDLV